MQEFFFSMAAAVTLGNFLTFAAVMLLLGMLTIKYDSPSEVGPFASLMGFGMIALVMLFSSMNGWLIAGGYMLVAVVVAVIQVCIFDVRAIARRREKYKDGQHMTYRWMTFLNPNEEDARVNVDRSDLSVYILAYIGCAPFLVIRWMMNEFIQNISEWIADRIGNALTRRLSAVFNIDALNAEKRNK